MIGSDFPISEYLKDHIIDAETISRGGSWWTAILLIEDPVSKEAFISLYRWKKTKNGWKIDKSFPLKKKNIGQITEVIERYSKRVLTSL
jgi:hypothetical protein